MKILFVITSLGPGGAERSLADLLPHLVRHGHEAEVVCISEARDGVQALVAGSGTPIYVIRATSAVGRVLELRSRIRDFQPDLIHTALFGADLLGRVSAIATGVTVLTSLVNTQYEPICLRNPRVNPTKLRVVQALDAVSARLLTHHFHAITNVVKRSAVKSLFIDESAITVIERGRDPAQFPAPSIGMRAGFREELGFGATQPVILSVGRQEFQKGHATLLRAMPAVLEEFPDAQLLVAGREGNETKTLEGILYQLDLAQCVRFLGHRTDIPKLLAAADVFAFPSLWEGLGGSIIEGLAVGCPIVATRIPAVVEVLQADETARLVPPNDPYSLAAALIKSLSNPDLQTEESRLSRRQLFLERYTSERAATRTIALYESLRGTGHRER